MRLRIGGRHYWALQLKEQSQEFRRVTRDPPRQLVQVEAEQRHCD